MPMRWCWCQVRTQNIVPERGKDLRQEGTVEEENSSLEWNWTEEIAKGMLYCTRYSVTCYTKKNKTRTYMEKKQETEWNADSDISAEIRLCSQPGVGCGCVDARRSITYVRSEAHLATSECSRRVQIQCVYYDRQCCHHTAGEAIRDGDKWTQTPWDLPGRLFERGVEWIDKKYRLLNNIWQ